LNLQKDIEAMEEKLKHLPSLVEIVDIVLLKEEAPI
jgi:hypothetical protein